MTKEIKKYYHFLDLPYDATIEDVKARQKVMIKVLRAKAIKRGVSYSKQINKIAIVGEEVISFINGYGVQPAQKEWFKIDRGQVLTQLFCFIIIATTAVISLVALL